MSYKVQFRLSSQFLIGCGLLLGSIDLATASEIPVVSTKVSLSDLTLDKSPSTSTQIAQSSSEQVQPKKNSDVGLGIQFGNSASFGIDYRVGVADNFSLRSSVYAGSQPGAENKRIPAGSGIFDGAVEAGLITNSNTGISYGIAATYDFKIDSDGKTSAYIGPKVAVTSVSGPLTVNGQQSNLGTLDLTEAKIGLIFGADMAVTKDLDIGVNATYNFSRSISASVQGLPGAGSFIQPTGSSLDFGIRAAYRF